VKYKTVTAIAYIPAKDAKSPSIPKLGNSIKSSEKSDCKIIIAIKVKTANPVPAASEISLTYTKNAVPEVQEKATIKRQRLIKVSHKKLYLIKK
jgi:hypothetical protein